MNPDKPELLVIYQFADCTLDPVRRELRRTGALVAVEPQVFDVLALLIDARDRVVSRDELLDSVWHGRIVSEATLASRLNAARTAIGDTGAAQRLIRTLPRRGVRFVGEVRIGADTPAVAPLIPSYSGPRLPTVAILRFANMSGSPAQDYFADGMAEEIINALSRCSGLRVIARSSSFTYKDQAVDARQVGQELGAGYVLEGSVRRAGKRLRITGRLIDAGSGAHLWSDRFDGALADVFALQDRVAGSVAAAIEPTLQLAEIVRLARDRPARLDAYDHVLRAYAHMADFTPAGLGAALACLDDALTLDPAYPAAMAASAYTSAQCHFQGWAPQDEAAQARAVQLAWHAAELAPNDAQVLWMAAFAVWNMAQAGRDRARDLFRRSVRLNPNSAMALTFAGWIETMCGNSGQGRAMVLQARQLDPRDAKPWLTAGVLALTYMVDEDYATAAAWAEQALAQNRRFAVALRVAAVAAVKLGQPDHAADAIHELLTVEPGLTIAGFLSRIPVPVATMAKAYADALKAAGLPEH